MKRTIGIISTTGAVLLGIAACGGTSSPAQAGNAASSSTAPAPGASPSANAAGRRAGGGQALAGIAQELPQIKQCLTAAGISTADLPTALPTFRARPSGQPRPSFNPADRPTARPSGGFGGGGFGGGAAGGGFFQILRNTADVAALKACGITVPTFTGRAAAPNGSPATT